MRPVAIAIGVQVILVAFILFWNTGRTPPPYIIDDSFYYFKIAHNIVEQGNISFDGIHTTNGFHPLWQIVCTAAALFPIDRMIYPVVMAVIGFLFYAASIPILYLILGRQTTFGFYLFALNPCLTKLSLYGMEWGLAIFCLALLILSLLRGWKPALIGILGGICILARLDILPLVLILILVYNRTHRRLAVCILCLSAIIMPYLIWSKAATGEFKSVSSYIKFEMNSRADVSMLEAAKNLAISTGYAILPLSESIVAEIHKGGLRPGIPFGILTLFLFLYPISRYKWKVNKLILILGGWSAVHLLSIVIFTPIHASYCQWYMVGEVLFMALLFSEVWNGYKPGRLHIAAVAVVFISSFLSVAFNPYPYNTADEQYVAAQEINRLVPDGEAVASWSCGRIGYYADRPVVNLDGLVNDYEYARVFLFQDKSWYLKKESIRYVCDYAPVIKGAYMVPIGADIRELWRGKPVKNCEDTVIQYLIEVVK